MNYLSPNDMVFYKNKDTNKIMSSGYNIQSILLANQYENTSPKNNSLVNLNKGLLLPAGLVYQPYKPSSSTQCREKNMGNYENNEDLEDAPVLENDIYDKLIELVKVIPIPHPPTKSKQTKRFRVGDEEKKNKTRKKK